VGSAYVTHYLDAVPGATETVGSFAERAVTAAFRGCCCCPAAARNGPERVDNAVRASGAELTILRSTWFDVDHKVTYGDPGDQARNSAAMTRRRIG
jgi:hypothetical protein